MLEAEAVHTRSSSPHRGQVGEVNVWGGRFLTGRLFIVREGVLIEDIL